MKITNLRNTATGPVAQIDGIWHSVNAHHGAVDEIRYPLSEREIADLEQIKRPAPLRLDQLVYWRNLFGIFNYGRVESFNETFVTVRLPEDEESGGRQPAAYVTLTRTTVATDRNALKKA
jgi:hypothetical protein